MSEAVKLPDRLKNTAPGRMPARVETDGLKITEKYSSISGGEYVVTIESGFFRVYFQRAQIWYHRNPEYIDVFIQAHQIAMRMRLGASGTLEQHIQEKTLKEQGAYLTVKGKVDKRAIHWLREHPGYGYSLRGGIITVRCRKQIIGTAHELSEVDGIISSHKAFWADGRAYRLSRKNITKNQTT